MELEDDEFLQGALSSFARARRIRMLQLIGASILIFSAGVLVGMSIKYETVEITVEVPALETPADRGGTKTTRA